MNVRAAIASLKPKITGKVVLLDVDACAAHVPIVHKIGSPIDRVHDVESVAGKVSHVRLEQIAHEIDVRQ